MATCQARSQASYGLSHMLVYFFKLVL